MGYHVKAVERTVSNGILKIKKDIRFYNIKMILPNNETVFYNRMNSYEIMKLVKNIYQCKIMSWNHEGWNNLSSNKKSFLGHIIWLTKI